MSFFALTDGETDRRSARPRITSASATAIPARIPAAWALTARRRPHAGTRARAMDEIVLPTVRAMAAAGTPYSGVLYAGLMLTAEGPQADRVQCPLRRPRMPGADAAARRRPGRTAARAGHRAAGRRAARAFAAVGADRGGGRQGYPGTPKGGGSIGRSKRPSRRRSQRLPRRHRASGEEPRRQRRTGAHRDSGADTFAKARARAYRAVDQIDFPGGFCRRDIGWRELQRTGATADTTVTE